jgi:hypothetical protein
VKKLEKKSLLAFPFLFFEFCHYLSPSMFLGSDSDMFIL